MAEQPEVQVFDVKAYAHGADSYPGIETLEIAKIRGPLIGIRKEGEEVPSKFERAGTNEGPVTVQITSRSLSTLLTLLAQAEGDATVRVRNAGEGADKIVTLTDVSYERSSMSARRDNLGSFSLSGKALAAAFSDP
jgi:hypothetical protein